MHGNHHRDCTRRACEVVGVTSAATALLVEWVTFPDRVKDLYLDPLGQSFDFDDYFAVAGNNLACLDHFERVKGKGSTPGCGYSRRHDPSASWANFPNIALGVSTLGWQRGLGSSGWAATHPALKLAGRPFDEVEYVPAHGMVRWFDARMTKWNCSWQNKCKAMAGQFHMLQDGCMEPHAKAYLLSGHSTWESKSYDAWIAMHPDHVRQRTPTGAWAGTTEQAVIEAAHHALGNTPATGALEGYVWTVLVLRAMVARYPWLIRT